MLHSIPITKLLYFQRVNKHTSNNNVDPFRTLLFLQLKNLKQKLVKKMYKVNVV